MFHSNSFKFSRYSSCIMPNPLSSSESTATTAPASTTTTSRSSPSNAVRTGSTSKWWWCSSKEEETIGLCCYVTVKFNFFSRKNVPPLSLQCILLFNALSFSPFHSQKRYKVATIKNLFKILLFLLHNITQ